MTRLRINFYSYIRKYLGQVSYALQQVISRINKISLWCTPVAVYFSVGCPENAVSQRLKNRVISAIKNHCSSNPDVDCSHKIHEDLAALPITDVADKDILTKELLMAVPPELDPVTPRGSSTLEGGTNFLFNIADNIMTREDIMVIWKEFGENWDRVVTGVEELLEKTKRGESRAFAANSYFSRDAVVGGILRELGVKIVKICCEVNAHDYPAAATEAASLPDSERGDVRLESFKKYCASCHQEAVEPAFMAGSDEDILQSIRTLSPKILDF